MALSSVTILNALSRWGKYRTILDVPYAAGDRHYLDIYAPGTRNEAAPTVIFFYGGNWEGGDKSIYRFVGGALARQGIIAVIPDYRVFPKVRFPTFLEDGARAFRWVHDHAAEFGGDPGRIVLMGHSAGAHIAAMLSYDEQWLATVDLDSTRDIRGFVGLAGPYDFLPLHNGTLKVIFGPEDRHAATQPINFVGPCAPPTFLASGCKDDVVDCGNATRLGGRIVEKGGSVMVKLYDRIGHRTLIGAFAAPLRPLAPVFHDTVMFVQRVTSVHETLIPNTLFATPR